MRPRRRQTPISSRFSSLRLSLRASVLAVLIGCAAESHGVVFYETGDPNHNTTAPNASYAGSGWQYEGLFGGFLGTMISPQLFITAQHIGAASGTFVSTSLFNGVADVTYTIDTSANNSVGFWNITGTDLRIYKINETFTSYAQLYTGTNEIGQTLVTMGRGGPRSADVIVSSEFKGWETGGSDGVARWGANTVSTIYPATPAGDLLAANFDAVNGQQEAFLSSGDSGGGVFIKDGATWKLAGVNYAIEADFDTNNTTGDSSEFTGAIFDKGGLYQGSDGGGWTLISDNGTGAGTDIPEQFFVSRISSSATQINAIIQAVPEPGGALLVIVGMLVVSRRKRRMLRETVLQI